MNIKILFKEVFIMSISIERSNYFYNITNNKDMKEKRASSKTQVENTDSKAESLIKKGINLSISQKGFEMVQKLEPFEDTYETEIGLLKGIGTKEVVDGTFMDILSENYQSKLKELEKNYSGEEYDKKLSFLDKAYSKAAKNASKGYVKQLRILTGDIVIKPTSAPSYSTQEEAESAYQKELEKEADKKYVIDSELSNSIQISLEKMLIKSKTGGMNNSYKFFNKNDIQNIGNLFLNKKTRTDISGINFSDFALSIIEKYNSIYK